MIRMFCDKCESEILDAKGWEITIHHLKAANDDEFHLCKICTTALREWLADRSRNRRLI